MEHDAGHEARENEPVKQPLSWSKQFSVVGGTVLAFAVSTIIILVAIPGYQDSNKVTQMVRYGLITTTEILVILIIQSIIDKYLDGREGSYGKIFTTRAMQFGIRKPGQAKATVRDTLLLLFCALVPLDALSYMIPGTLSYIATSQVGAFFNGFTWESYITIGLVYNLITGVKEEVIFRGYFLQRFKEQGTRHTSWILVAAFFGILHFQVTTAFTNLAGSLIWLSTASLVGLLFGGYFLNANRMLPLVLSHGIGNFISAAAIWFFHQTGGFPGNTTGSFLLVFYGPMIIAGIVLAIIFWRSIHRAFSALRRLTRALASKTTARDWLVMLVTFLALWGCSFFLYL
jgi:membrane protease YdiL (CAAX protease family)